MAFYEPFSKPESQSDPISTTGSRRNNGDGCFRSCLICCGFVQHTIDLRRRMNLSGKLRPQAGIVFWWQDQSMNSLPKLKFAARIGFLVSWWRGPLPLSRQTLSSCGTYRFLSVKSFQIRIYRGMVDSNMEKGEQPMQMAALLQSIDEIVKVLA